MDRIWQRTAHNNHMPTPRLETQSPWFFLPTCRYKIRRCKYIFIYIYSLCLFPLNINLWKDYPYGNYHKHDHYSRWPLQPLHEWVSDRVRRGMTGKGGRGLWEEFFFCIHFLLLIFFWMQLCNPLLSNANAEQDYCHVTTSILLANMKGVTIPCLYLHFISSLLAIHFLFSSNPLLAFLLISSSIFSLSITQLSITQLSITQLFIIQPFYYSALYYSAFSLFSSITQRHFY